MFAYIEWLQYSTFASVPLTTSPDGIVKMGRPQKKLTLEAWSGFFMPVDMGMQGFGIEDVIVPELEPCHLRWEDD